MNPGAFVAGGGGDGGGAGGKGGKNGNGKEGAGTGDGDDDASGDGNDGGCAEGDPVCPITGRMFVDVFDFGFGAPDVLRWLRNYSSRTSNCCTDIGHGWSHPYTWRVVERRRAYHVFDDRGREQIFRKRNGSSAPLMNGLGWVLTPGQGVRLRKDGTEYVFSEPREGVSWLIRVIDRNGNQTVLHRNPKGHLTGLTDSAGRNYRATTLASGLVTKIEVETAPGGTQWMRVVDYTYDQNDDLVCVTDAEGYQDRYVYSNHLMVQHITPTGLTYFYRYDGKDHEAFVLESWGEYPGRRDPALADNFPLPGCKGIHYRKFTYSKEERYSEVENSLGGLTRYFGDAAGRVIRIVSPSGAVEDREFHPETGEMIRHSDPSGLVRTAEVDGTRKPTYQQVEGVPGVARFYEPDGTEVTYNELSQQVVRRRYDSRGNLTFVKNPDGTWEEWGYDQRGLPSYQVKPNGARTSFEHDAMGRLVLTTHPNGDTERREYDYLSRPTAHVGASGERTEWRYDRRSEIIHKKHPDGSEIHVEYDAIRRPTMLNEAGRVTRYEYGGMAWLTRVVRPSGAAFVMKYDTEGLQREVHNPDGQTFSMTYDAAGFLVGWKTFEGVAYTQGHDVGGNITWFESPLFRTEVARNAIANVESLSTPDDDVAFSYTHRGVALIDNGVVPLVLEHDAIGRIVKEKQGSNSVELAWIGGSLAAITSTVGLPIQYDRLPSGRPARIQVGNTDVWPSMPHNDCFLDTWGNDLIVRREYSAAGALTFLGVARSSGIGRDRAATGQDAKTVFWAVYRYDQRKNLIGEEWHDGRRVAYELDANDQVVKVLRYDSAGQLVEQEDYGYTRSGNVRVKGATYDAAGRVIQFRGETFEYDAAGRLIRRISDAGTREYEWNGLDHLIAVRGKRDTVEMDYDARGRRMRRRLIRNGELVSDTSYVWSNETLLHERDEISGECRTYVKCNEDWEVLGHTSGSGDAVAYLLHPNRGVFGAVDMQGKLVWLGSPRLFGEFDPEISQAFISSRMLNQQFDEDVGLTYNRHRWYHAPTGQFVTTDPLFLNGSTNPREYALNPLTQADPSGLSSYAPTSNPLPPDSPQAAPAQITNTQASAAYLAGPGAWATAGAPGGPPGYADCPINGADGRAALDRRSFGSAQGVVDAAGTAYGCHSCGAKKSGYPDNADGTQHWTCDHQPAVCTYSDTGTKGRRPGGTVATATSNTPGAVRLYPHCKKCSNSQRNALSQQTRMPGGQAAISAVALAQMQHNLTNPSPAPPMI